MHQKGLTMDQKQIFSLKKTKLLIFFLVLSLACNTFSVFASTDVAQKQHECSPSLFICPERADLMAKYIYAKQREWNVNCDFGLNVYYHHLRVWNHFWELDPPKQCFDDFRIAFDNTLDSIKNEGFKSSLGAIPIGSNGILCNGAHRLTACLLYKKNVFVEQKPNECSPWGFDYFEKQGLDEKYLDAMALQYCELQPKSFIIVIFPSAKGHKHDVERIIQKHTSIVYRKQIPMTVSAGLNLVLTAYENEGFVREGIHNDYASARFKASQCFPEEITASQPLQVYLVEAKNIYLIKACKNEIRSLFNIGNDSAHSTDTHAEAIVMARTLFNKNSLHCLSHRKTQHTPLFRHYFEEYKQWLKTTQEPNDWFCVDSGAVLAAYGLRDCVDLDFLHHGEHFISTGKIGLEDHNFQSTYHPTPIDDILFDPENYFYYNGVKFCSLRILKQMKKKRNEQKDSVDVGLIDSLE